MYSPSASTSTCTTSQRTRTHARCFLLIQTCRRPLFSLVPPDHPPDHPPERVKAADWVGRCGEWRCRISAKRKSVFPSQRADATRTRLHGARARWHIGSAKYTYAVFHISTKNCTNKWAKPVFGQFYYSYCLVKPPKSELMRGLNNCT